MRPYRGRHERPTPAVTVFTRPAARGLDAAEGASPTDREAVRREASDLVRANYYRGRHEAA